MEPRSQGHRDRGRRSFFLSPLIELKADPRVRAPAAPVPLFMITHEKLLRRAWWKERALKATGLPERCRERPLHDSNGVLSAGSAHLRSAPGSLNGKL